MVITDVDSDVGGREATGRFLPELVTPGCRATGRSETRSLSALAQQAVDCARHRVITHQRARRISDFY